MTLYGSPSLGRAQQAAVKGGGCWSPHALKRAQGKWRTQPDALIPLNLHSGRSPVTQGHALTAGRREASDLAASHVEGEWQSALSAV